VVKHTQEAQHLTQEQMKGVGDAIHQHPSHARRVIRPNMDMNVCVNIAVPPSSVYNRREHSAEDQDRSYIFEHIDDHAQLFACVTTMGA
jgi:hypothetical protein